MTTSHQTAPLKSRHPIEAANSAYNTFMERRFNEVASFLERGDPDHLHACYKKISDDQSTLPHWQDKGNVEIALGALLTALRWAKKNPVYVPTVVQRLIEARVLPEPPVRVIFHPDPFYTNREWEHATREPGPLELKIHLIRKLYDPSMTPAALMHDLGFGVSLLRDYDGNPIKPLDKDERAILRGHIRMLFEMRDMGSTAEGIMTIAGRIVTHLDDLGMRTAVLAQRPANDRHPKP